MIEHKFTDLSAITYRIFTKNIGGSHRGNLMILEFSGEFGIGSKGHGDGAFIRVTTRAALSAWQSHGVIFDLRNLQYEWGDNLWEIYGHGLESSGVEGMPYATVESAKCMKGLSTCLSIVGPVFDTLEKAIENMEPRVHQYLDDLFTDDGDSG